MSQDSVGFISYVASLRMTLHQIENKIVNFAKFENPKQTQFSNQKLEKNNDEFFK